LLLDDERSTKSAVCQPALQAIPLPDFVGAQGQTLNQPGRIRGRGREFDLQRNSASRSVPLVGGIGEHRRTSSEWMR